MRQQFIRVSVAMRVRGSFFILTSCSPRLPLTATRSVGTVSCHCSLPTRWLKRIATNTDALTVSICGTTRKEVWVMDSDQCDKEQDRLPTSWVVLAIILIVPCLIMIGVLLFGPGGVFTAH